MKATLNNWNLHFVFIFSWTICQMTYQNRSPSHRNALLIRQ